jgi:hypothetical protein
MNLASRQLFFTRRLKLQRSAASFAGRYVASGIWETVVVVA